jgi:DNA polymerase-1
MPDNSKQPNEQIPLKKVFLLDAYALIFRAFYAFIKNPRINSKGTDTSAIFGFLNSLMDIIRREKPEYLAVAFDKGKSIERTELLESYKANRLETPEGIKVAVPYIHELLKAMHIPIIELQGWEADDLIGTLAKQAVKENFEVYMVTPDKDFAQLVEEHIFMYKPSRMGKGIEIWGIPEVQAKFGVKRPEQVIDFLGMMGDSVDNIPGLPGVGEKTAKKFLAEFGTMENLFENTDKLKGKMREKVEANKELGLLSKKLATINVTAPIQFDAKKFKLDEPDFERTNKLFAELEFRRISEQFNRLFRPQEIQEETAKKPKKTPKKSSSNPLQYSLFDDMFPEENTENTVAQTENEHLYQLVELPAGKRIFKEKLMQADEVALHTYPDKFAFENTDYHSIFGFNKAKFYQLPLKGNLSENLLYFREFFTNNNQAKIGYDLKQVYKLCRRNNIDLKGKLYDIMLMHYLVNPDMRNDIEVLSENYLGIKIPKLDKKASLQARLEQATLRADVSLQIKAKLIAELQEGNMQKLYDEIEEPLLKILGDMELEGILLDTEVLADIDKQLTTEIASLEKAIFEKAGEEFNIGSPKQLGIILFEKLALSNKPKKTKTGQYSTSEDILSKFTEHDIVVKVLEWRSLSKLKSTYVDALPKQINPVTGRIHTNFNQSVAATGRLSSNDPNLQNIPIRTAWGKEIRKAFVAKNGHVLMSADYSQIELRLIAAFSKDEEMIKAFNNGEDIHIATAAKVFGLALDEVTKEQRSHAKSVNYGIIYGLSAHGLSQQTGLSRTESKQLIDTYFETYPTLLAYIKKQVDLARENGYVETILGRRRYLRDIDSRNAIVRSAAERNAVNAPLQGSAADIIKKAMIEIQKELHQNYQSKMLLQVHDELVFEVPEDEVEEVKKLIKQKMENVVKLDVPITVDIGIGNNWYEAH